VTNTLGPGFVKIFPEGGASPVVSTINYSAGQTIANAAVVPLGTGGGVTVGAAAGTDLILDTNGYYDASGLITQVSPGTGLSGGGSSGNVTLGIAAGGVTSGELASNAVTSLKIAANAVTSGAIASGQVVKSVNGLFDNVTLAAGSNVTITKAGQTLTLSASGGASGWGLSGNSGLGCTTSPCASFLGTTDANDALETRVGNRRVYRIESATDGTYGYSPNMIGGFEGNLVTGSGTAGATIGGGGYASNPNQVTGSFGTVGGGSLNTAGGVSSTSAGGYKNKASGNWSTVSGGDGNTASGVGSAVSAGFFSSAIDDWATVGGGYGNVAGGTYAVVPGGWDDGAYGVGSFAAGRHAAAHADGVFIWGDGTSSFVSTTTPNQFLVQATGGFGINTNAPAATLDVAGLIRSSSGGFKFPDGTTQATAGLSAVNHDATLAGSGSVGSPLGVAAAGVGPTQLSAAGSASGQVLTSNGSAVSWQNPAGLTSVAHDATLTGNGTAGTPLGLMVPLAISSGSAPTLASTSTGAFAALQGNNSGSGIGVAGSSAASYGVYGTSSSQGVHGESSASTGIGVYGFASSSTGHADGVYGQSDSNSGAGVYGFASNGGYGVQAGSAGGGYGIYAFAPTTAGYFAGNVQVTGTLSKGGGSFKIDDPIDPENKYLYHSFVESPDMMNIYNGNVVLDGRGEAVVQLPEWFGALNRDFRYQLTCIGDVTPVYVKEEVQNNRFTIAGLKPGVKVSWQITGIRKDPFANAHRIPVEEEKAEAEKGRYLHPREYGQPEEKGIESVRLPKP
jgi:hypothetical protein